MSFWQWARARWGRLLLAIVAYNAALTAVRVYGSPWLQWLWHALVCCFLAYQWGTLRERERCWKELLASRHAHQADLDRFVGYLQEQRGYVNQLHELVERDQPKEQAH